MGDRRKSMAMRIVIGAVLALAVAAVIVVVVRYDTTGKGGSGLGRGFDYDVEKFRKIAPDLIWYEEKDAVATGFQKPRAIAVGPQDRIYVTGDAVVRVFNKDGSRFQDISTGMTALCLAVTRDGAIYVGMRDHIEVYDMHGAREASWKSLGETAVVTSIALSDESVFVADAGSRAVLQYERSGKLVGRVDGKDAGRDLSGFVVPSPYFDVAIAPDGLLRVVNPGKHRIEAYGPEGELVLWWGMPGIGTEGFSGCCNPAHFTVFPDGRFVTSEKGRLHRVKIHDADGEFLCFVVSPEDLGEGAAGFDVAVDSGGRVLVLDTEAKKVRVFVPKEDN